MAMKTSAAVRILVGIVTLVSSGLAFTVDDETRLRYELLANYSAEVRPSNPTIVEISFQATSISSMNLRSQEFGVTGWWSMHWTDNRLSWDEADYGGVIPVLQFYEDKIWTPAVVVDNSLIHLGAIDEDTIPLRVDTTGFVSWSPPGLLRVSCEMDITQFPFDSQTCAIQLTSFGYTVQELDLDIYGTGINLNYYSQDGEWDLEEAWSERSLYTEGDYDYARVYYYFKLTRKPLFYGLNMLLPVIVTAVLTVFVFVLPAESGEKIGYCLTVMLAFMVILTVIAGDLPTTATHTSMLELHIAVVLIMSCLSVVLSILVLAIYHKPEDTPIPPFLITLTLLGMRINCYDTSCVRKVHPSEESSEFRGGRESRHGRRSQHGLRDYSNTRSTSRTNIMNGSGNVISPSSNRRSSSNNKNGRGNRASDVPANHPLGTKFSELNLRPLSRQSTPEDGSRGREITWQTISIVLDGVLFRFYAFAITVITIVFVVLLVA